MKSEHMNLHNIISIDKWQSVQDALAAATGLALITVDYKGEPVTKYSNFHAFCQSVRQDEFLHQNCQKCDSRGGLEAARLNAPYIYLCHYDIIDAAIPIIIDDKYIGAIMAGQVLPPNTDDMVKMEKICPPPDSASAVCKRQILQEQYNQLPRLSPDRMRVIVEMLFHLCKYVVEEAIEKYFTIGIYEEILSGKMDADTPLDMSGYSLKALENVKRKVSSSILNTYIDEGRPAHFLWNPVLKPACDYIHDSGSKDLSLQKVAGLCHVSKSYFSRLFAKTAGETYSTYIARLKIERAKRLLTKTDITVTEISDMLGFNDSGYFIKLFKKCEGLTPLLYRRYWGRDQQEHVRKNN